MSYVFFGAADFLSVVQLVTDINSYPGYWVAGRDPDAAEKLSAELLKQKFQMVSYLLTFLLLGFHIRRFIQFFTQEKTLLLLVVILLLTAFTSEYPVKVVTNLVHLSCGIIATWLYFIEERRQENVVNSAGVAAFVPIMLVLGGSVVLFMAHNSINVQDILSGKRFSGLSGNPNTQGGVCIVGAWAVFTLISVSSLRSRRMFWLIPALAIVLFLAWTTASATTLTIIAVMALLMIGFHVYKVLGKKIKAAVILGSTMVFFGVLLLLVVQQSADDYALAATEAVGKDLTFTGRTELWLVAWDAFVERPVLGWGYDNHQTVLETNLYGVPYNHYHNGYLDSLVSGGFLLAVAILLSYGTFFSRYREFKHVVHAGFPLIVAVIAVSIQNLTEYSMFRNNTAIWHIYFISFICVAVITVKPIKRAKTVKSTRKQRRSSKRKMSW